MFGSTMWSKTSMEFRWENFQRKQEIVEAYEKLKERDIQKSNLFANISHELRTPLQLILGPVISLLDNPSAKKFHQELSGIRNNAVSLLNQVSGLLEVARLEAKKVKLEIQRVNMRTFLEEHLKNFSSAALKKSIGLSFESLSGDTQLHIDPDKFNQILMNLFSNAFKFTEARGVIRLFLEEKDSKVFITLEDSGVGIPKDKISSIFERFMQVDMGSTRRYSGTGIGLSIVKELLEQHEAVIEVESKHIDEHPEEHGSRFTIIFDKNQESLLQKEYTKESSSQEPWEDFSVSPYEGLTLQDDHTLKTSREKRDPEDEQVSPTSTEEEKKKESVLVVDDHPGLREYVKNILEKDFQVYLAKNGEAGLKKAKKLKPDIIIADIMMPVMDGNEMAKRIREKKKLESVPIIFVTAREDLKYKLESLSLGVIDYITKPFSEQELRLKVKNLIQFKKAVQLREKFKQEKKLRKEVEDLYHSREQFFSIISHEMRTPMAVIQMRMERYLMKNQSKGEFIEVPTRDIEHLFIAAQEVTNQLNEILELAKYRAKKKMIKVKEVNIHDFFNHFVEKYTQAAKINDIQINCQFSIPEDSTFYVDPIELRTAITNLFHNSIKYIENDGLIEIRVRKDRRNYVIDIKDNGIGILDEVLPYIFEEFSQVGEQQDMKSLLYEKIKSTGMGLAIVKEAVSANCGWVYVKSRHHKVYPDKHGTTFTIKIPIGKKHLEGRNHIRLV